MCGAGVRKQLLSGSLSVGGDAAMARFGQSSANFADNGRYNTVHTAPDLPSVEKFALKSALRLFPRPDVCNDGDVRPQGGRHVPVQR
ncbi:hypothetical protein HMPREF9153_0870 [Cutibacterium avidum ATCC 25577]|uniref:Uncharacterized protein n=1 Tax=Cutibacterium avidum ATCC 25577 TaxID=997355 RepID=G4CWG3_9ACTN|nr:hypothetical protein HMPREF9153_0870 [Cutibacterium avidum ATCC 25577]